MKNDAEAARIALAGGADSEVKGDAGQTPLDVAKEQKSTQVIALLAAPVEAIKELIEAPTKTAAESFDIFISHSGKDKAHARFAQGDAGETRL